jgi:hypothetical protein
MRSDFVALRMFRLALTVTGVVASLLAGGCSSTRTAEAPTRYWAGAPPAPIPGQGQRTTEVYKAEPGDPIKEAPVEPAGRRAEPDDPNEPFSPNYGRGRPIEAVRNRVANASD